MKIAIVSINDSLNTDAYNEVIQFLNFNIRKLGKSISLVSFVNDINELKHFINTYDFIFCVCDRNYHEYSNVTNTISQITNKTLLIDYTIENNYREYARVNNIDFSTYNESLFLLPEDALPLIDLQYDIHGLFTKINSSSIIVVPNDFPFLATVFESQIRKFFEDQSSLNKESIVLRCYGILEQDAKELIAPYISNAMSITYVNTRLDLAIYISFDCSYHNVLQPSIAEICSALSKFIYSTDDSDLFETVSNLLTIQQKKVIIGETITLGDIAKLLNGRNSQNVECSYVFNSFDHMFKFLKIEDRIINQFGKCSVNTVYELDNMLLQSSSADIAIFILGCEGNDTCYIAIGDIDGIHRDSSFRDGQNLQGYPSLLLQEKPLFAENLK